MHYEIGDEMKTTQFYLSSPSATDPPSPKKLSLQEHRTPVILIIVSVVAGVAALLYVDNWALKLILFVAGLGFALAKAFQVKATLEQPVITTARPTVASSVPPRPTRAEATAILSDTTTPDALPVEEVAEIVKKSDAEEDVLYKERFHWFLLVEGLLRTVPVGIVLWVLALVPPSLADSSNRASIMGGLTVMTAISGLVLLFSFVSLSFKSKSLTKLVSWLLKWLRWPMFVLFAISVVYLFALKRGEIMVSVVAILAFLGTLLVVRTCGKWYYTYIVATTKMFGIEREIPWFFFLKDSKPAVPIRKLTSVTPEKSTFEKAVGLNCGSIEADTPGQLDKIFHSIRRIRDHERLTKAINSMIS